jgi:ubiquinone/menaquinone biosynthesis C-methylase UbiE
MDPIWEEIFQTDEWGKYPPEYLIRFVARNFYGSPDRRSVRLLDAGCGPGACTWYMAREGFQVSGIDGSPAAIRYANERLRAESLSADLQVGDYVVLPWPNESFDGVIDNCSFYSNLCIDWQLAVNEVYRVLKPEGLFLTCSFTPDCWGYGIGRQVELGTFTDIPEGPLYARGLAHFVGEKELRHLLRQFRRVDVEREQRTLCNQTKMVDMWIATAVK